jgi:hypothetical protein
MSQLGLIQFIPFTFRPDFILDMVKEILQLLCTFHFEYELLCTPIAKIISIYWFVGSDFCRYP